MTAKTKTTETNENPDMEEILPEEGIVHLGGVKCRVKRLKTREFFALLKVMTSGLGPTLSMFNFSQDQEEGEMASQLIAMATMAIPNALEEFTDFMQFVVEPVDRSNAPSIRESLDNPEIDETMEIISVIILQEAADFRALMGKAQATFSKMPQAIQTKKSQAG